MCGDTISYNLYIKQWHKNYEKVYDNWIYKGRAVYKDSKEKVTLIVVV